MQVLITTGTAAGTQPIYLPNDKAPVPFGDPLAASLTAATPSIITVPGYIPSVNDAVSITVEGPNAILATQAGAAGLLLHHQAETAFRDPRWIACSLVFFS